MNDRFSLRDSVRDSFESSGEAADDFKIRGIYYIEHWRGGELLSSGYEENVIPFQGREYILRWALLAETTIARPAAGSLYMGIVLGSGSSVFAPAASITYASPGFTEFTSYTIAGGSAVNRGVWNGAIAQASTSPRIDSSVGGATVFTMTGVSGTPAINGIFISNFQTKEGTLAASTGRLISAAPLTVVRNPVATNDILNVSYSLIAG